MLTAAPDVDLTFFRKNGYVVLRDLFDPAELQRITALHDQDRKECPWNWHLFGHHQTINCDALVTTPEFDSVVRHPRVLPVVKQLMGGPICFSEICIRHMAFYDAPGNELARSWHRDRPHLESHPLRMDYIQFMLYLTDVDESTHCFSISPESIDDPVLRQEEQLAKRGIHDIHGPAGTVVLFNISALHTATVRKTNRERKSVQIYYGHADRPYLSEDSLVPVSLWRDHQDASVRNFYGNLSKRTRIYLAACGG